MAKYGIRRVTPEITKRYHDFLSFIDRHEELIHPMNVISYDDGSLVLTVTVYDCTDPTEAMELVIGKLESIKFPYTDVEIGPVEYDSIYVYIHFIN